MVTQPKVVKDYHQAVDGSVPPQGETQQPITETQSVNNTQAMYGDASMPMTPKQGSPMMIPVILIALVLGVGTGYLMFTNAGNIGTMKAKPVVQQAQDGTTAAPKIEVGKVYGSPDSSTFKDSAEGVLLLGGVNGEGSYHIVREGGESQNVYLTSSALDLAPFVDAHVIVKGETFKAQRAGWLMDVGQVKVVQLNAQLPDWAQKAAAQAELKGSGNQ